MELERASLQHPPGLQGSAGWTLGLMQAASTNNHHLLCEGTIIPGPGSAILPSPSSILEQPHEMERFSPQQILNPPQHHHKKPMD